MTKRSATFSASLKKSKDKTSQKWLIFFKVIRARRLFVCCLFVLFIHRPALTWGHAGVYLEWVSTE